MVSSKVDQKYWPGFTHFGGSKNYLLEILFIKNDPIKTSLKADSVQVWTCRWIIDNLEFRILDEENLNFVIFSSEWT